MEQGAEPIFLRLTGAVGNGLEALLHPLAGLFSRRGQNILQVEGLVRGTGAPGDVELDGIKAQVAQCAQLAVVIAHVRKIGRTHQRNPVLKFLSHSNSSL